MFYGCKTLYNIDELKYLNSNFCTNFSFMFCGCSYLSDIKSLENWNVSNGTDFRRMFSDCSSLSDIKSLENWNVSNGTDFGICSMNVNHKQILNHQKIGMYQKQIFWFDVYKLIRNIRY